MSHDKVAPYMEKLTSTLAQISKLKSAADWDGAIRITDAGLRRLLAVTGPKDLCELSISGIVARLASGPHETIWLPYRQIEVIALL
jgi:hypothetical protein